MPLTATFDVDAGTMALYRNGEPVEGFYTRTDDPWQDTDGTDVTSATDPRGIKIGGSFPWAGSADRNPCDCRMDALMYAPVERPLPRREPGDRRREVARRAGQAPAGHR